MFLLRCPNSVRTPKDTVNRILVTLIVLCSLQNGSAQQGSTLSTRELALKHKADGLAAQAHISVIPVRGEEVFGKFISNDEQAIRFYDVDRKIDVSFPYSEVLKIKNGYGGYNTISKRHTDRTVSRIFIAITVGALTALVIAVARTH